MAQPDSIVPNPFYPQSLNRYAYVLNNPILYNDPSGHDVGCAGRDASEGSSTTGIFSTQTPQQGGMITPLILPRRDWEAREPGTAIPLLNDHQYDEGLWSSSNNGGYMSYADAKPNQSLADILDTVVIHHEGPISVMDNGYFGADAVNNLQLHAMENGLYDIQYHFIVDPDGVIYEGRDIGVRGAHVSSVAGNTGKVGILWLGAFTEARSAPTDLQVSATASLLYYLDQFYGIDAVYGHGELETLAAPNDLTWHTDCPGPLAFIAVNQLKQLIFP